MKPKILITMGDPCGIGPEIIVKVLTCHKWTEFVPIVVGNIISLEKAKELVGSKCKIMKANVPFDEPYDGNSILVYDLFPDLKAEFGRPNKEAALASVRFIEESVKLLKEGIAQAMVTSPVNKAVIKGAGFEFRGHTELIAQMCGVKDFVMMLVGSRLRVSLVTTHIAMREVPRSISAERIKTTSTITYEALKRDFGIHDPRLAIAGLNPHAGEGGIFGDEEELIIRPAVEELKAKGIGIEGPFPPDTVFYRAYNGEFDAVISLYHDQGLIPLKLVHFEEGVNVTLGLPIIRTSVDHGTAYEIAGKNLANHKSLFCALDLAFRIFKNRSSF